MFGINGLLYIPQYISQAHHDMLIKTIDGQPWRGELARRTQHYGYVYDYRARSVDASMYLGELPPWLNRIAQHLHDDGLVSEPPDQAIINEYMPGQGIADHIDSAPSFGEVVTSLSLAAPVLMELKKSDQIVPILLEPRSLFMMRGVARYEWTHGIAKRKQDSYDGQTFIRERRLSITFRKVIISN
jgi:alkylated DNA repair dioxygenase AlkB